MMMKRKWLKRFAIAFPPMAALGFVGLLAYPSLVRYIVLLRAEHVSFDIVINEADALLLQPPPAASLPVHVEAARWDKSFSALDPERVHIHTEGAFLVFRHFWVEEEGLFVVRRGSGFQPSKDSDPSFEQISGRLYWYRVKG